jgi:hypothetical protein
MTETATLRRLREFEEELEAFRRAFQAVLRSEAIDAEHAGRASLAEGGDSCLGYDEQAAATDDPDNQRLRRVIGRAQQILAEATPEQI